MLTCKSRTFTEVPYKSKIFSFKHDFKILFAWIDWICSTCDKSSSTSFEQAKNCECYSMILYKKFA